MLDGKVSQMIFDGLVQVATERVGRGERAPGVPHRDESVSVHDVNLAGREVHGTLRDLTRHVGGIIVDDQGICIHAHACQQPTGFAMAGLDVGDVRHAASEHGGALVDHPLKHKGVDTVVGPSMANRQGFDDEQGEIPFHREIHSMLEGEVVCCSPGRGHPVQHVGSAVPVFRRPDGQTRAPLLKHGGGAHRFSWATGGISRTVQGPAVSNDASYTDALPNNHGHQH